LYKPEKLDILGSDQLYSWLVAWDWVSNLTSLPQFLFYFIFWQYWGLQL
jgi:hypothetical protein